MVEVIKADATVEKWIREVLRKLFEDFRIGADFKNTRWIFTWNDKLTDAVNRANILYEHNALRFLANTGAITLHEENLNSSFNGSRFNKQDTYFN